MRAAEAAKNTNYLIENTIKVVQTGNELSGSTLDAFNENTEIAGKIAAFIDEIAAASHEQAHGIEEINRAILEMQKVTQQSAANAEESAGASEELNAQADQVKTVVLELEQLVNGNAIQGSVNRRHLTISLSNINSKPPKMIGMGNSKASSQNF